MRSSKFKSLSKKGLQFKDVAVTVNKKTVISGISGTAQYGKIFVVMGPSGAGKTTLLNTFILRQKLSEGNVKIDGVPLNQEHLRQMSFVFQDDMFFPVLTARQTLNFYVDIKFSGTLTKEERIAEVKKVADLMFLNDCLDTKIGDTFNPGISGGERKRLSIACELMGNPMILLLDEPTSGLDAGLALKIMQRLVNWCVEENKILLTTIHQPSSQIFHMFDDLILLCEGKMAFKGKTCQVLQHFSDMGIHCEENWNPADFILIQIQKDSEFKDRIMSKAEEQYGSTRVVEKFVVTKKETTENGDSIEEDVERFRVPWLCQFKVLMKRNYHTNKWVLASPMTFLLHIIWGLLMGVVFFDIEKTETRIHSLKGAVFAISYKMVFGFFMTAVFTFYGDQRIVKKERVNKLYSVSAYFTSKLLTEMPLMIAAPLSGMLVCYWMIGFSSDPLATLTIMSVSLLIVMISQGLGVMLASIFSHQGIAVTTAEIIGVTTTLAAGFLAIDLPNWSAWIIKASFVSHCYNIMRMTVLHHNNFSCLPKNMTSFTTCLLPNRTHITGVEVLEQDVQIAPAWLSLLVILAFIIIPRYIAYLMLKYFRLP